MLRWSLVMGALVLGAATPAMATGLSDASFAVKVTDTDGKLVTLQSLLGKPAVLFYEDRDSTSFNQALKDDLFRRGKEKGMLDKVSVIAVANLSGFNWFPAKNFAASAVRDAEKKFGVPIYVDWTGAMVVRPWSLPKDNATVLLLDANGEVVLRKQGRLTGEEREQVLGLLESLAGLTAAP
jgi:hypothetical protein